jgi:predicted nucleic acid-binding protein
MPNVFMTTTRKRIAIDTNVVVALVDSHDKWHGRAVALRDALKAAQADLLYFDSVVNETVSVLARRAEEQGRAQQFSSLLEVLLQQVPAAVITWLSAETQRLYDQVIELVRNTLGVLNFHDALIALGCQELGVTAIASFDRDFDQVAWLTRIDTPEAMNTAYEPAAED